MSSRSLNRVLLIGNLTRDVELRYTPQGTPVCSFGLATNRSWQPAAGGDRQEATEFHRIVAWNKLAELCSQLLFKGRKVFVEGRLQTRNWTTAEGQERQTVEIVIDNMIVLDSKRREGQQAEGDYGNVQYADTQGGVSADNASGQQPVDDVVVDDVVDAKSTDDKVEVEPEKKSEKKEEKEESKKVKADDIPF